MKLLSVFFLFFLIAVSSARENDSCEVSPDCEKGEYCIDGTCTRYIQGGGFVADNYECNPKCAEGLACYHGICVDGN